MADTIDIGNGQYLFYVNGGIQGIAGKPFAHKKGKRLVCQTDQQPQQTIDNKCLCSYKAVQVYRTYCYLDDTEIEVYSQSCPASSQQAVYDKRFQGATTKREGVAWKWCGWYQKIGCQSYPGNAGWTDPQVNGLDAAAASKQMTALCAPSYFGDKGYTHAVQQRHVTNYKCCTTEGGLDGCCREISDSDDQGGDIKCVCQWSKTRSSPFVPWGPWKFVKKIGCVPQNKYLMIKDGIAGKIQALSCTSARGYAIMACGTCSDSLVYKATPPSGSPDPDCKYWGLFYASYQQTATHCGWGQWQRYPWTDTNNPPDQSIVKGVNGWAPAANVFQKTVDGRKAGVHLYQCKTKRVWHWVTFDTQTAFENYDPSKIKRPDDKKCRVCTESTFQTDHHQNKNPGKHLEPGQQGAPCVAPQLPRSVFQQDLTCFDLWMYQLQVDDHPEHVPDRFANLIKCMKKLSYKKEKQGQTQHKKRRQLLSKASQWQLFTYSVDGAVVMDNIGKTVQRSDSSWYYLRVVPCGQDPDQWDDDGGAEDLPQQHQYLDACIRAFLVGVKCVSDSQNPGQRYPKVFTGDCGKWKKIGVFTQDQVKRTAGSTTGYDLTKTNKWQPARGLQQKQFDMVYIKTSTTRDVICDRLPKPPTQLYRRIKALQLSWRCSDSSPNWNGMLTIRWPDQAYCISDSLIYCQSNYFHLYAPHSDRTLKDPIQSQSGFYLVPGCKVYIPIQMQAQSTPFTQLNNCTSDYDRNDQLLADSHILQKLIFNCNITFNKYSLWVATNPCACHKQGSQQEQPQQPQLDIGLDDDQPQCSVWSPVYALNSTQQIQACSCNQQKALEQIMAYLAQFTQGQQDLQNPYYLLSTQLQANKVINIKINTPGSVAGRPTQYSYYWFYLHTQQIQKPSQYTDQQTGIQFTQMQITQAFNSNPCSFAEPVQIGALQQPMGRYIGTLNKFVPYCYFESQSGLGHQKGSLWIGTKREIQSQHCKCGQYNWCSDTAVPAEGWYLDQQLTQVCPSRVQSNHIVLLPPSDAIQVYNFGNVRTQLKLPGQLADDTNCQECDAFGDDQHAQGIFRNLQVHWGGDNAQKQKQLQQSLQCCPVYKYKYRITYKVLPIPGQPGGAPYKLQIGQDSENTGYYSFQPVSRQGGQWQEPNQQRKIIWGQPTCDQLGDPQWDTQCSGQQVGQKQFQIQFLLAGKPHIDLNQPNQMPWDFFRNLGSPDMSKYKLVVTGWQSYVVGTGVSFQWNIDSAKMFCDDGSGVQFVSSWDSAQCNPQGHQFTHYTTSPFSYATEDNDGNTHYISPRSMQWNPAITHPQIPKALWFMARSYTKNIETGAYTYTDTWGSAQNAELTCQSQCSWSPGIQSCQMDYTLRYTQPLQTTTHPVQPYGQLCFNVQDNMPSFQHCNGWKCTRRYRVAQCLDTGKHQLVYSDAWEAANEQTHGQQGTWSKVQCGVLQLYWGQGAQAPTVPPQSLPGCNCPVPQSFLPKYLKRQRHVGWRYSQQNGLIATSDASTFSFACQDQNGQCQCNQSSVNCVQTVLFQPGGICTTDPSANVTSPQAEYRKIWMFNNSGVNSACSKSTDWAYVGLTCSRKTNPIQCQSATTQWRYAYTTATSAAAITSFNRIPGPGTRYWRHQYTYNGFTQTGQRTGTWQVYGPYCQAGTEAGWNTLQCNANFGQVYTEWSTDCTQRTQAPSLQTWPQTPYTRWYGTIQPRVTGNGTMYCYNGVNATLHSTGVACTGQQSPSIGCMGGGKLAVIMYTPAGVAAPIVTLADVIGNKRLYGFCDYTVSLSVSDNGAVTSSVSITSSGLTCDSQPRSGWDRDDCYGQFKYTYTAISQMNYQTYCVVIQPYQASGFRQTLPANDIYVHRVMTADVYNQSCVSSYYKNKSTQLTCTSGTATFTCIEGGGVQYDFYQPLSLGDTNTQQYRCTADHIQAAGGYVTFQYTRKYTTTAVQGSWKFVRMGCQQVDAGWNKSTCDISSHTFSCSLPRGRNQCYTAKPSGTPQQRGYTNFTPPAPKLVHVARYKPDLADCSPCRAGWSDIQTTYTNTYLSCTTDTTGWQGDITQCTQDKLYKWINQIGYTGGYPQPSDLAQAVFGGGNKTMLCWNRQTWVYPQDSMPGDYPVFQKQEVERRCYKQPGLQPSNPSPSYTTNADGCYISATKLTLCSGTCNESMTTCIPLYPVTSTSFYPQKICGCEGQGYSGQIYSSGCWGQAPQDTYGYVCGLSTSVPCRGCFKIGYKVDGHVTIRAGGNVVVDYPPGNQQTGAYYYFQYVTVQLAKGASIQADWYDIPAGWGGGDLTIDVVACQRSRSAAAPAYSKAIKALDIDDTPDVYQQAREQLDIEGDK